MATKEKTGIVVSNKMNKTIVVLVENRYAHPLYGKTVKTSKRFMAHDEFQECNLGDQVTISETRPISRNKRWKVKQIINKVKINSLEGYFRQIAGWREFIKGVYQNYDEKFEQSNFFNNKRLMKKSWYDGTTGIFPLDYSIKNASKYAWTHHIERLMIQSNIMNLCEIEPSNAYRWFMEHYMDASEWVMYPNVYGMGLFSDGGVFSTKPYICGSSYFRKMMDFKKDDWCDVLDGLYWRFIQNNKDFFVKNPRLSMMVRVLEKMNKDRKKKIINLADEFIETNTYES